MQLIKKEQAIRVFNSIDYGSMNGNTRGSNKCFLVDEDDINQTASVLKRKRHKKSKTKN
jgi:hypothetical protein